MRFLSVRCTFRMLIISIWKGLSDMGYIMLRQMDVSFLSALTMLFTDLQWKKLFLCRFISHTRNELGA